VVVLYANIFQPLIDVFEAVLKFFHNSVGISWGWSIVAMTVVIRAVLLPLTFKQFHSMQKLQQHMPELKAIQAKYKDDKQRQQQEVMKFYKENNVNPFSSCLPLAAQLPVFISLFYMLREDLRINICPQTQAAYQAANHLSASHTTPCGPNNGANFLFISDITNKATGITLIVLILLYVGTQLASSLMMASPTMDKTQRQIMTFMPLVFVFIIISFPAGLIVYWITTNTWTMGQQYFIKRAIGPVVPATASADGGGRGGGGGKDADAGPNGSGGGLAGLLRGVTRKAAEPAALSAPKGGGTAKGDRAAKEDGTAKGGGAGKGSGSAKGDGTAKGSGAGKGSGARIAAPPQPPRKKKKRSGRRR
jgi:YidC/Oxa1 family membrane protein insertase